MSDEIKEAYKSISEEKGNIEDERFEIKYKPKYVKEVKKMLEAKPGKMLWKGEERWQALDGSLTISEEEAKEINKRVAIIWAHEYIDMLRGSIKYYILMIEGSKKEIPEIEALIKEIEAS